MKILGRIIRTLALSALAIVAMFNSFTPDTTPVNNFNAEIASSSQTVIEDSSTN